MAAAGAAAAMLWRRKLAAGVMASIGSISTMYQWRKRLMWPALCISLSWLIMAAAGWLA